MTTGKTLNSNSQFEAYPVNQQWVSNVLVTRTVQLER